jgi:hypothetical protein
MLSYWAVMACRLILSPPSALKTETAWNNTIINLQVYMVSQPIILTTKKTSNIILKDYSRKKTVSNISLMIDLVTENYCEV